MKRVILWLTLGLWILVALGCGQYEMTDPTGATVTILNAASGENQQAPDVTTIPKSDGELKK